MLTEGHTRQTQNQKRWGRITQTHVTAVTLVQIVGFYKTKGMLKQRSMAWEIKESNIFTLNSFFTELYSIWSICFIYWGKKNITDLIEPKCDAWGSFIHPKTFWSSFPCPPPTKLPSPHAASVFVHGTPGLTCMCVCVVRKERVCFIRLPP